MLSVNSPATAQWQAVRLHPDGYYESEVYGVSQGRQAGDWQPTSLTEQPVIWSGSASGAITLSPVSQSEGGLLYGISGAHQVGAYTPGHAALWSNTPASRVDLNPAGATSSEAYGCSSTDQVGYAAFPTTGLLEAGLWRGSAASWVDLHPPAVARNSIANATDGVHQVGTIQLIGTGVQHAAMWSGTAASFLDMNPPGARGSEMMGIGGGQQAGLVVPAATSNSHAALWFGTSESAIDLHPAQAGTGFSELYATDGSFQVGDASIGGGPHAGIWQGTAASFVDLHAFLPPGYGISVATSVDEYQGRTWVGGYAENSLGNREAFLWVSVPAPGSTITLICVGVFTTHRRRLRL
jgi:hypothetical protein